MRSYRVDLIDFDGKILNVENIESATDIAAIDVAQRIFGNRRHYRTVEVWQQWRLVYQDRRLMTAPQLMSWSMPRRESSNGKIVAFNGHSRAYAASR